MDVYPDFKELLALFNKHHVEYLVVCGYALAFHGAPRFTGDLDLLIHANQENAERILTSLDEFGFGKLNLETNDFIKPGQVIQLGVPPVRVDLLTSIDGVSWSEASTNRVEGVYGNVLVNFIGRDDFITNKKTSGRQQDLADIEALNETLN